MALVVLSSAGVYYGMKYWGKPASNEEFFERQVLLWSFLIMMASGYLGPVAFGQKRAILTGLFALTALLAGLALLTPADREFFLLNAAVLFILTTFAWLVTRWKILTAPAEDPWSLRGLFSERLGNRAPSGPGR